MDTHLCLHYTDCKLIEPKFRIRCQSAGSRSTLCSLRSALYLRERYSPCLLVFVFQLGFANGSHVLKIGGKEMGEALTLPCSISGQVLWWTQDPLGMLSPLWAQLPPDWPAAVPPSGGWPPHPFVPAAAGGMNLWLTLPSPFVCLVFQLFHYLVPDLQNLIPCLKHLEWLFSDQSLHWLTFYPVWTHFPFPTE